MPPQQYQGVEAAINHTTGNKLSRPYKRKTHYPIAQIVCNFVCNLRNLLIISTLGGEAGIRTLGTLAGTTVFETAPIDRSGTSPFKRCKGTIILGN